MDFHILHATEASVPEIPGYGSNFLRRINCRKKREIDVIAAAASVLPEVDGEGNIHIDVGEERKDTRKVKETWKGTTEVVVA